MSHPPLRPPSGRQLAETLSSAPDPDPEPSRYQAGGDSLLDGELSSLAHSPPTRGPSGHAQRPPPPPPPPQQPPLVPVLDERLGCFQLGPPSGPQEMFTLTVIVVYAQHLQLVRGWGRHGGGRVERGD